MIDKILKEVKALRKVNYSEGQILDLLLSKGYVERDVLAVLEKSRHAPHRSYALIVIIVLVIFSSVLGLLLFLDISSDEKEIVRIGVSLDFSSSAAGNGLSIRNGIDLASRELDDIEVKVIYKNSKCDGDVAAKVGNELITKDKITAIIGGLCSSETLAIAPLANFHKKPLISPSSTSPLVSEAGPYIYRLVPSDLHQADQITEYIKSEGFRKVGIIYVQDAYGVGLFEEIKKDLKKQNAEIVDLFIHEDIKSDEVVKKYIEKKTISESFELGEKHFEDLVKNLRKSNPDVIVLVAHPEDGAFAIRKIRESGINRPIIASEALKSESIFEITSKKDLEGLTLFFPTSPRDKAYEVFAEDYVNEYSSDPGTYSAEGFDAMNILQDALASGARTGEEINKYLRDLKNYDGASGKIEFDKNGDIISATYARFTVQEGQFVRVG